MKSTKSNIKHIEADEKLQLQFVGVDLGGKINYAYLDGKTERFSNDEKGYLKLLDWAKSNTEGNFCIVFESTGFISRPLCKFLLTQQVKHCCFRPDRVRRYIASMGQKAKSDLIDCRYIAEYARWLHATGHLYITPRVTRRVIRMREVETLINSLKRTLSIRKTQLKLSYDEPECTRILKREIVRLEEEINRLIACNMKLIMQDELERKRYEALLNIQGIGEQTARMLTIQLPMLGYVNRKAVASYAGLAPYERSSSGKEFKRHLGIGKAQLRSTLYMCAVSSMRFKKGALYDYRTRLQNRKNDGSRLKELSKKEIVIRLAHKLLDIANGVLREVVSQHQLLQPGSSHTDERVA